MRHASEQDCGSPFDLPNICFMGANVVSRLRHRRHRCGPARQPSSASSPHEIAGRRVPTAFDRGINRFTWLMIRFIAGHGAERVPDQRPDQARLAGGAAVRGGGGGRPHARDAADDRDGQPGQGRDRHVAQEGDRQAAQRDPEFRRDGRAVHRQDRHADAGPHHPEAPPRHPRRGIRAGAAIRLPEQPLPVRAEESARQRRAGACRTAQDARDRRAAMRRSTRSRSISRAAGCRSWSRARTASTSSSARARSRRSSRSARATSSTATIGQLDESHFAAAKEETIALNSDGFRVVAVAYKEMDPPKTAYSVADEADLTLLGYIAFLDPPKESAREAIAALAQQGRAGEGPDRRQRGHHAQDLP